MHFAEQELQWLLFPAAGCRDYGTGTADSRGYYGDYWSSRPNDGYSYYLNFGHGLTKMYDYNRASGYSVRCVQVTDEVAEP